MRFELVDMNTVNLANAQNDQAAQGLETGHRLEGSRFVAWQLCRLAAGGSRERPSAAQLSPRRVNRSPSEQRRWVKVPRWVTAGSRLQPSDRIAKLILRPRDGSLQALGMRGRCVSYEKKIHSHG